MLDHVNGLYPYQQRILEMIESGEKPLPLWWRHPSKSVMNRLIDNALMTGRLAGRPATGKRCESTTGNT